MALTYHFVTVPQLPPELRHQWGTVEIKEYLVREGEVVEADTPILKVQNWWAEMEILSGVPGTLVTTIFKTPLCHRGHIKPGDPIALVLCDPEETVRLEPNESRIRVVRQLHVRK